MRTRWLACITVSFALVSAAAANGAVDGDLDNSFSGDGGLVTDFNAAVGAQVRDAVVDGSGRLLVAGADGIEIGVARFDSDGSFDQTFGGDGDVRIDSGAAGGGERAAAIAVDPATGNILVLGDAHNFPNVDLVLARLLPNGDPDPAFDGPGGSGNGVFRLDFDNNEFGADIIANDDKVVFTASVGAAGGTARIVQLTSSGALDTASFGSPNGFFDFQFASGVQSFPGGLAQQDDGKFIVAGAPNATATYGVARITTGGALDNTFNSTGTIPGIARPPLPSGFIDANANDVLINPDGITVAGSVQHGFPDPEFDSEPMLSRVTFAGAPDAGFGSDGFAVLPLDTTNSEAFFDLAPIGDGRLLAGGTSGSVSERDQLLARFTATGGLDSSFSGDGYLETAPGVASASVVASPMFDGVAFLTGPGSGSTIAISAVCAVVPPGCPPPEVPDVQAVTPASGSNDNNPKISGVVPAGPAVSSVSVYRDAACTEPAAATGTEAEFAAGITVSVPDNSTTSFHARAAGVNGSSACSTSSVSYAEVTPSPPAKSGPTGRRAAALKKCAKIKKKAKKKRCKRRARKLPA